MRPCPDPTLSNWNLRLLSKLQLRLHCNILWVSCLAEWGRPPKPSSWGQCYFFSSFLYLNVVPWIDTWATNSLKSLPCPLPSATSPDRSHTNESVWTHHLKVQILGKDISILVSANTNCNLKHCLGLVTSGKFVCTDFSRFILTQLRAEPSTLNVQSFCTSSKAESPANWP